MKTIAYIDRGDGNKRMKVYSKTSASRWERITEALKDLRHTGNILVYLINGNKRRLLLCKP